MAYADIKLGYSCNNNCIHCVIADQKEAAIKSRGNYDRSTEEYMKELYDSRRRGCTSVTFTGGEPLIRKDLMTLLRYAKNLGYHINMQTNGRAFYYTDFTEKICSIGTINYVVALHGHTKELHESITRSDGFNQTVEGIKNLIALKQKVRGKLVISKKNYKFLPEIADFFINLGVKKMNFAFPHAQGNAWKYFDEVVPKYTDIMPYVHETIELCNKNNAEIEFEAIPFCFMQGYEKHVSELHSIDEGYAELKQLDGKTKNWQIVRKQIKRKFPQCKECKHDSICEGVWEEYPRKRGIEEFKNVH